MSLKLYILVPLYVTVCYNNALYGTTLYFMVLYDTVYYCILGVFVIEAQAPAICTVLLLTYPSVSQSLHSQYL